MLLTCQECKKEMKRITPTHLRSKNCTGLVKTVKEYKLKYPDFPIMTDEIKKMTAITLENMIRKHGEKIGKHKWDVYRQKQAFSNSFEYKQAKHGWTEEQFNEYNKNRAVTLENLIERHGEVIGNDIWENYVEAQRYSNTLEYFIEKHGQDGIEMFYSYNKEKGKSGSVDFVKEKYNLTTEEAVLKLREKFNTLSFYSKSEIVFIDDLSDNGISSKYNYKTSQFSINANREIFFYDFTCTKNMKIIEYNGDYWHANPEIYESTFVNPHNKMTSKEVWVKDERKLMAARNRGFSVFIVWEKEYLKNRKLVIENIKEWWNK